MSAGYQKSPKSGQFKRSGSDNLKGRTKQTTLASTAFLFYKVANEPVPIKINSNEVKMTRWEALVRQIQTLALNGNPSASRLLHKIRKLFPGSATLGDKYLAVVSDVDMKL